LSELNVRHEAMLTALGIIREAVGNGMSPAAGDAPGIEVRSLLQPLMLRCWHAQGEPESMDATVVFETLVISMAQVAGAAITQVLAARYGREPTQAEVMDCLMEMQVAVQVEEVMGGGERGDQG
jgi:hypothetical protein